MIATVFHVVLVDASMLPPHELPQLEPKLLLEVDAFIKSKVGILVIFNTVTLCPSLEVVSG